jgi:hypothetical protein
MVSEVQACLRNNCNKKLKFRNIHYIFAHFIHFLVSQISMATIVERDFFDPLPLGITEGEYLMSYEKLWHSSSNHLPPVLFR